MPSKLDQLPPIDPAALNEIWQKDPLELTEEDQLQVIKELRNSRKTWQEEDAQAKVKGTRARTSRGAKKSLADLQIEPDADSIISGLLGDSDAK